MVGKADKTPADRPVKHIQLVAVVAAAIVVGFERIECVVDMFAVAVAVAGKSVGKTQHFVGW